MRIAILVHSFPPKWMGGTEIASYNLAKRLGELGHEVHVITELDHGMKLENFEDGFFVHRILRRRIRILGYTLFWIKVLPILKKINPDIIHCQNMVMGMPAIFKKWLKKPIVVYHRDNIINNIIEKYFFKIVLKRTDVAIALSESMKNRMLTLNQREILVISNGIKLERFQLEGFKRVNKSQIRKKLGLDSDDTLLIYVGRLHPIKGVRFLIEAMNILKNNEIEIKLIIVGDGHHKRDLEMLIKNLELKNQVEFKGWIPHEIIPEYMAASDIFILPSLTEGFPNVCLEAMASGLPIITTKIDGMSEIIEDGKNGYLVSPKNSFQIAERLKDLIHNKNLRKKFAKENKLKVKEYEFNSIVNDIETVYLDIFHRLEYASAGRENQVIGRQKDI